MSNKLPAADGDGSIKRPVTRGGQSLTAALAKALGLPANTVRAVLTLDAYEPPMLELTVNAIDAQGHPIVLEASGAYGESVERRIAQVQFMVRLERFQDSRPDET